MSFYASNGDGKIYYSKEFRGSWCTDAKDLAGPRRHIFDCELAAAAAAYTRGPRMNDGTIRDIASLMATRNNAHSYNSSASNSRDHSAAMLVLQSAHNGERVQLSAHQAAHIREGAAWVYANRDSLPKGFVGSVSRLYDNVYDSNNHKVVDGRMFRGYR